MKLGTFCSGIGAPEVAGMGAPIWAADIEPFPNAVRAHHMPDLPNLGDITAPDIIDRIAEIGLPDIVVAGLPCQPFSVAGLRRGEEDPRNLTVRFVEIADAIDDLRRARGEPPVWWLVENVPGLLSDKANAFGALLGGLVGHNTALDACERGGWTNAGVVDGPRRCAAWRVLDAQHFGVAQRRRRVFVLARGGAGAWAVADALLPVIDSMSWHPAPRREAGQGVAALTARGVGTCGADDNQAQAGRLIPSVASTLTRSYGDACGQDFENPGMLIATNGLDGGHTARTLTATATATATDACHPLAAGAHAPAIAGGMAVRRLTPVECERLQGFPDGYTAIPTAKARRIEADEYVYIRKHFPDMPEDEARRLAADGPRYKALGNSMAVPVMAWIGRRIAEVEQITSMTEAAE